MPASEQSAPAPRRRSRGATGKRRGGKGALIPFLLVSAIPAGAVVWFLLQSSETQERIADMFGDGGGGRAIKAGICLAVLVGLARVALPAFHSTSGLLRASMAKIRQKPLAARVLLFPAELVIWLAWFLVQILFAVDAVLILATGALVIILVVRIVNPSVLQEYLPPILS